MKIKDVRTIMLECPTKGFYLASRTYLLVEIETDEGIKGIGQSSTVGHPEVAMMIEKRLKPLLIGEDPFDRNRLWEKLSSTPSAILSWGHRGAECHAISGVDIALWDIVGKACNQPIHKLIGGYRDKIRAYAGMPSFDMIPELLAQGFTAFKFAMLEDDVHERQSVRINRVEEMLKKARAAVGEADIMFDGLQRFDLSMALKVAKICEKYNVFFFEEPVLCYDFESQATLTKHTIVPLSEGEKACGVREAADLVVQGGIQIVQPEIPNCGGITVAMKMAAMAESTGRMFCPHCGDSPVDVATMLQVVGAAPNALFAEWLVEPKFDYPMRWELLKNPIKVDSEGYVEIPKGPGLGIELDEKAVKKYSSKMS